jgi:hypothetical protein
MPAYPVTIRRCQHIKVNGTQCGSPALRNERRCYFHEQCIVRSREIDLQLLEPGVIRISSLEDPNSIQLGLAEVMRMLVIQQIDHRTATLLLRALRTAAANVKFTFFEPKPTHIVIDPESVENRPLGASAWSTQEGREYDCDDNQHFNPQDRNNKDKITNDGSTEEGRKCMAALMRMTEGLRQDPDFLDRPHFSPATPAESSPSLTAPENEYTESC